MAFEVDYDHPNYGGLGICHFMTCHTVWNDIRTDQGFSLARIIHRLSLAHNGTWLTLPRIFSYQQFFGEEGEYTISIRLVRLDVENFDDVIESLDQEQWFGPWQLEVINDDYVLECSYGLENVRFSEVGIHEFQLWYNGWDEPLARERIEVRFE